MENLQRMLRVQIVDTPFPSETRGIRGFQSLNPSVNRTTVRRYKNIGLLLINEQGTRELKSQRAEVALRAAIDDFGAIAELAYTDFCGHCR